MRSKFLKRFSILCGGAVFLTGCGKKEAGDSSSKCEDATLTSITSTCSSTVLSTTTLTYPATTTLVTSTSTMMNSTSVIVTSAGTTTTYTNSSVTNALFDVYTTCTIIDTDSEVLEYFSKMGNSVRESFDSDELLDKGKSYFIYCVDFLFYDGEIGGIKFNDLTDSAKQQLLRDISTIDSLICTKYPNYKADIKEGYGKAYNKASEVIKSGSENINEFSRDKLGEDNYNKMREYKDLFIDTAFGDWDDFVDIVGKGKQKVKDWYEGLK